MTRLDTELRRLFHPAGCATLLNEAGHTRALVLEVGRPADWEALARLWEGVQSELGLPPPAIAVNGRDGFQLWMALAQAVPAAEAHAFLSGLRQRHLADVPAHRVALWPQADAQAVTGWRHTEAVPRARGDQWSAFVTPGLAPVFAETPWLDIPPSEEGQADLLAAQALIDPAAWQRALARLSRAAETGETAVATPAGAAGATLQREASGPAPAAGALNPHAFLARVMADESVPMALRIDAAKALLPYWPAVGDGS